MICTCLKSTKTSTNTTPLCSFNTYSGLSQEHTSQAPVTSRLLNMSFEVTSQFAPGIMTCTYEVSTTLLYAAVIGDYCCTTLLYDMY